MMVLFIVIWSRVNVGCHSILESCFAAMIGMAIGFGYYSVISRFYNDSSINFFKQQEIDIEYEDD